MPPAATSAVNPLDLDNNTLNGVSDGIGIFFEVFRSYSEVFRGPNLALDVIKGLYPSI